MSEGKPGKRARTRDQILIAAQEILIADGAAALTIRNVADRAGLVHGSFYNYYRDTAALLDGLADLLFVSHAIAVAPVRGGVTDHAVLFANTSRQTLRLVQQSPEFSRLMFDSGIAPDRLLTALHEHLRADLRAGSKAGTFQFESLNLAVTLAAGAMFGLAIELHRARATVSAIDDMSFQILRTLGVPPTKAKAAAFAKVAFVKPPATPLSWRALGLAAPEAIDAA